jgi:hypothetical protein
LLPNSPDIPRKSPLATAASGCRPTFLGLPQGELSAARLPTQPVFRVAVPGWLSLASDARKRNTWTKAAGPAADQLREWFAAIVAPLVAKCSIPEIRRATGLSTRYVIMIRQGLAPHPRHYAVLAELVGAEMPG